MKQADHLSLSLGPDASLVVPRLGRSCQSVSPHQSIRVENTRTFGRLYCLDGDAMAAEADEFMLHESLVHIPALAHPNPRRALILGGGDGASARELLRHPGMECIVVAELDAQVVDVVRTQLPALAGGAFDSSRVHLKIGDAARTLDNALARGERFDLLLFDLIEADEAACAHLHQPEFLRRCATALAPGGMIHVQLGSPFYRPDKVASLHRRLRSVFSSVRPGLIHVPLYGGPWLLACCSGGDSDEPDQAVLQARLAERRLHGLRHYNPALHLASRALPNHIHDLLA